VLNKEEHKKKPLPMPIDPAVYARLNNSNKKTFDHSSMVQMDNNPQDGTKAIPLMDRSSLSDFTALGVGSRKGILSTVKVDSGHSFSKSNRFKFPHD